MQVVGCAKALEVQQQDAAEFCTQMVAKLGADKFFTAQVGFESTPERNEAEQRLTKFFAGPDWCARVSARNSCKDKPAVYQYAVEDAIGQFFLNNATVSEEPDKDKERARFGCQLFVDAIDHDCLALLAGLNLGNSSFPFQNGTTDWIEVACWTGGESQNCRNTCQRYFKSCTTCLEDVGRLERYNTSSVKCGNCVITTLLPSRAKRWRDLPGTARRLGKQIRILQACVTSKVRSGTCTTSRRTRWAFSKFWSMLICNTKMI